MDEVSNIKANKYVMSLHGLTRFGVGITALVCTLYLQFLISYLVIFLVSAGSRQ